MTWNSHKRNVYWSMGYRLILEPVQQVKYYSRVGLLVGADVV